MRLNPLLPNFKESMGQCCSWEDIAFGIQITIGKQIGDRQGRGNYLVKHRNLRYM